MTQRERDRLRALSDDALLGELRQLAATPGRTNARGTVQEFVDRNKRLPGQWEVGTGSLFLNGTIYLEGRPNRKPRSMSRGASDEIGP